MCVITKVMFVTVFVFGLTSAQISKDMCLGRMNGFLYLDPNDCSGYIECRQGVATMQQCPAGEAFELSLYYCMVSSFVECGTRMKRPIVITSTMKPDNSIPTLAPTTIPLIPIPPNVQHIICRGMPEGIMLPNPNNCRSYIECLVGVRLDRMCNVGDLFDARVGFCLPDYAVDCGTRGDDQNPSSRYPPMKPTTSPTRAPPSSPTRVPPTRPITNPPASDSQVCSGMADGKILMNPNICNSYYECRNNQVIDRQCKSGNYFDIRVNLCLQDTVVDCGDRRVNEIVIIPQLPEASTTEKSTQHDMCADVEDGMRFADPVHCNNYYECQRNFRIERVCKQNEMFDLRLKMCLSSAHVDCGSRKTLPNQEMPDNDIYPSCKSAGVYFLHHPLDCEAYFICANGVLIQHSCAPGIYFNSEISQCDKPENTNCSSGDTSTNHPPNVIPQIPRPICKTEQQFFPSLVNCAQYFICISGKPILMSCPRETLWNSRIRRCDTPNNVICAQKYNILTDSYE